MPSIMITGASAGIGRATAELFLSEGWTVGLLARREDELDDVAGGRSNAIVLPADVTDENRVAMSFQQFQSKAGRLDVLFNNAGVFTDAAPIDEVSVVDWDRAVSVNLTGMFLCAQAAFRHMRQQNPQGGRIINNGSISAHVPREGAVTYTVTKHGITGLTRQLSLDGRPFEIACGQIDIGNARTELLEGVIEKAVSEGAPVPPTMDVSDVAASVLHMARLPAEANVQFMTVMATKMPYIGRG